MATSKKGLWKKGRGKLGVLDPLIGAWEAESDSPMGRIRCTRTFSRILGGHRVLLEARWLIGKCKGRIDIGDEEDQPPQKGGSVEYRLAVSTKDLY